MVWYTRVRARFILWSAQSSLNRMVCSNVTSGTWFRSVGRLAVLFSYRTNRARSNQLSLEPMRSP